MECWTPDFEESVSPLGFGVIVYDMETIHDAERGTYLAKGCTNYFSDWRPETWNMCDMRRICFAQPMVRKWPRSFFASIACGSMFLLQTDGWIMTKARSV